jgi:hypothetical protein
VRVADVGNEEFPKARLRALAGGDDAGHVGCDGNELVHGLTPSSSVSCHELVLPRIDYSVREMQRVSAFL